MTEIDRTVAMLDPAQSEAVTYSPAPECSANPGAGRSIKMLVDEHFKKAFRSVGARAASSISNRFRSAVLIDVR